MNLDQLNHLSKQISADSKSAKNNSGSSLQRFQVENEEDYESDSDDLSMYTMNLQQQVSDPGSVGSYNSPGTSSLKFFGNSYGSAPGTGSNSRAGSPNGRILPITYENGVFEKPLPQSETPVVYANPPRIQQSQSHQHPMIHVQSAMQLGKAQSGPPGGGQHGQHGHSLTGFIRNMQSNNAFNNGNGVHGVNGVNGITVNTVEDDVFGNLPEEPLPGTPSEHQKANGALGFVDEMLNANQLGVQPPDHQKQDSYANAVVLGDNVEVQDLSDSDEFGANFANINIPVSLEAAPMHNDPMIALNGGVPMDGDIGPRQNTDEVLYPFMKNDGAPKAESKEERLDQNHEKVQQLTMFGYDARQIEAAWKLMKANAQDHNIVPDHGVFTEKMLDYLSRAQKEDSKQQILGAYKQSNSNSYYANAFPGGF